MMLIKPVVLIAGRSANIEFWLVFRLNLFFVFGLLILLVFILLDLVLHTTPTTSITPLIMLILSLHQGHELLHVVG